MTKLHTRHRGGRSAGIPGFVSMMALLCLLATTLSCQSQPAERTRPATLPAAFSESGASELPDRWWTTFEDATLDDLVETALAGNPGLKAAWDRLAAAEATAGKAGAALEPTLDTNARTSRTGSRRTTETASGEETIRDGVTDLSLGLTASWEIDLWGRVRSTRDAAALDADARAEDVRAAAVTLSAEVASAWYRLVEETGQITLLEAQIHTNEQMLQLVTLRFRRGTTDAADVLRQRQLVEARRGELATARSSAETTALRLSVLLGRPPTDRVPEPPEDLVGVPPLPATGLPAELVGRRPDVSSAWMTVLAADRRVAAAVADRYPRLSLSASASTDAESLGDLFSNWAATLAANLAAPLLDGGSRAAEVDRTYAVASAALHDYGRVVLTALEEVEAALVRERRRRELIASLETQLELSRQGADRVGKSYASGAEEYLRVLESLSSSQVLERTLLSTRRALVDDRIELCRALAGGFELDRPAVPGQGQEVASR